MRFAEDDDMVEALATDRADQSLDMAILPGRAQCDGSVPDAHGSEPPSDDGTIGTVVVANEVSRRFIPWERLGDLQCDPFGGRVRSDIGPDEPSSTEMQDRDSV